MLAKLDSITDLKNELNINIFCNDNIFCDPIIGLSAKYLAYQNKL